MGHIQVERWAINVMVPIPVAEKSGAHHILVRMDYFLQWEAVLMVNQEGTTVVSTIVEMEFLSPKGYSY